MITLTCAGCGKEAQVDPKDRVGEKPILVWWDNVEKLCKECRATGRVAVIAPQERDWTATIVEEFGATVVAERVQSGS